jgi:hypothetical protein
MSSNPFGHCDTCAWHTADARIDQDGDTGIVWRCWFHPGEPCLRMSTTNPDVKPPACCNHYREE